MKSIFLGLILLSTSVFAKTITQSTKAIGQLTMDDQVYIVGNTTGKKIKLIKKRLGDLTVDDKIVIIDRFGDIHLNERVFIPKN